MRLPWKRDRFGVLDRWIARTWRLAALERDEVCMFNGSKTEVMCSTRNCVPSSVGAVLRFKERERIDADRFLKRVRPISRGGATSGSVSTASASAPISSPSPLRSADSGALSKESQASSNNPAEIATGSTARRDHMDRECHAKAAKWGEKWLS